jgi:WbqC-like protein family
MTVACLHQPNFLPWTKLIDKVLASDIWIVYDSVQYTKTEFHSRQRIKARTGQPVWLTVPVVRAGRPRFQALQEVELCVDHDWRSAHLRLLREHYQRTPFWPEVRDLVEAVYGSGHTHLVEFNVALARAIVDYLGGTTKIVMASSLPHAGDNTERLIQLTRAVDADTHLTSTYGTDRQYIDWERVADAGIAVSDQLFSHPSYEQPHGPFLANLSVIDLVCNCGPDSAQMLAERRQTPVVLPARSGSTTWDLIPR